MLGLTLRIATVSNHLILPMGLGSSSIGFSNASSSMNDSYHRIHGEVSGHGVEWKTVCDKDEKEFTDIIYEKAVGEAIAKTNKEHMRAFDDPRDDSSVGVIILAGEGIKAFCSGGNQVLQKVDCSADFEDFGRFHALDLQLQIRRLSKLMIAMVVGYAIKGGNVLHVVCDMTITADNAILAKLVLRNLVEIPR
ncbi:hypothetical protein PTKIN_Ptkin17bG0083700 [Pterospermum kingtungense]